MKKLVCLLVCLLLTISCAVAENVLPDSTYISAREAVSLISYGEYDMALERLGMNTISASELKKYVKANCPEILRISVQTEVSVAWYDGWFWSLAVPFEAPDDGAVGALVFTLNDVRNFDTVSFSRWDAVAEEYSCAECVEWNKAYAPGYVIVGDW